MDYSKLGIIEPDNFSKKALHTLSRYYSIELFDGGTTLSDFISDKEAIFVRLKHLIDDKLISESKDLKYICTPTTGLNHIQVANKQIVILSLRGEREFLSTIRATPEHIFGLALALLRNYKHAFRNNEHFEWDRDCYRGEELYGMKVGIIGLGRIGRLLAGYFCAFGSCVNFYDPHVSSSEKIQTCRPVGSIDTLLNESDLVILCANYMPENNAMFGRSHFKLLENKYFINAARGELLDENSFLHFLENGRYKGVAIDVIAGETEGMPFYRRILDASEDKNVLITPHIGGATFTSMRRTEEFIADKLVAIKSKEN